MTDDDLLPIRFMPDYWQNLPLWGPDGLPLDAEWLGLSPMLTQRLYDWVNRWNDAFTTDDGWVDPAARHTLVQQSEELVTQLSDELPFAVVSNDFAADPDHPRPPEIFS